MALCCPSSLILGHDKNITLFISNLLTREYAVLPSLARRPFGFLYGFGFSHKTNQYKVIQIFTTCLYPHPITWRAKVHTLGSGVWRSIGIVPYEFFAYARFQCYSYEPNLGTYLKGTLYWVSTTHIAYGYNPMIFSFDLDSEQFQSLPSLPDEVVNQQRFHSLTLGVLGDHLCAVSDATICRGYLRCLDAEIWVLKDKSNDFGSSSSSSSSWWAKELVFKFDIPAVVEDCDGYFLRLIKVLKTGEILFCYGFLSIFYNPRDKSCSRPKFIRSRNMVANNMVAHVPSFISLKDVASGDTWEVINAPYKLQSEVKKGKSIKLIQCFKRV